MTNDRLNLSGSVDMQAAGDSEKPAKITILAYSGEPMRVSGYGNVVIEVAGVELPSSVPLLADHDASLSSVAGSGVPSADGKQITLQGTLSRSSTAGQTIIALSRDGVPLRASVGLNPVTSQFIPEGENVTANGRTFQSPAGGLRHITKSQLAEVSIVAIPADANTTVAVKAAQSKVSTMPETTTTDTLQAERQRITDINAAAAILFRQSPHKIDDIEAAAEASIQAGHDLQQAKLKMLEASQVDLAAFGNRGLRRDAGGDSPRNTLEAAFLCAAGKQDLAAEAYGERTAEAASRIRDKSFMGLLAAGCQMLNLQCDVSNKQELLTAAFSTNSIAVALSNVAGKALWAAYREAPATWRSFAAVLPAANFKPQTGIRPSFVGNLEQTGPGGEVKHGSMTESVYPWSISTFSKQFSVTRQDIINDDLGFLSTAPTLMARAAARTLNDLVWRTILTNAGSFFSGTNGNLLESGSELSLVSLATAVEKMRSQRDANGADIDIVPRVLVVSPKNEVLARSILNSAEIQAAEGAPMGNALMGVASLEVESRISNPAFQNADEDSWFLFASSADQPVIVGFLDGQQSPTVQFFGLDSDINRLGVAFRCHHDFGVALGDPRAAVRATGEEADPGEGG